MHLDSSTKLRETRQRIIRWLLLLFFWAVSQRTVPAELTLLNDMTLDSNALLMPSSATYGRAINGVSFQTVPVVTYNGYQYASWYHLGNNEDVYLARRDLNGTTWEVMDTGENLSNGDGPAWDAHNVISMGISGDGRIHLSWDHHNDALRYMNTDAGVTTTPGGVWNASIFGNERDSLNLGGPTIPDVTYPRFISDPLSGDLVMTYRSGISGNGDMNLSRYDASTGLWDTPHEIINGTNSIFYDDDFGSSSNNRNAYLNGVDIDATGRIHTTWTWREQATGSSNHDIDYAYSDDGGTTWYNNSGVLVGSTRQAIDLNSPGVAVVPLDRGNTLMNQQAQVVDEQGGVHAVMWHKKDEQPPVTGFTTMPAAYFHYYRDPSTGSWSRTELPTTRDVGSRPDVAHDTDGNLYVAYVSPGEGDAGGYYTNGDLIISAASRAAAYEDWQIVYMGDQLDFAGEPLFDRARLLGDEVLSVFLQENDASQLGVTGTPLHVFEFSKLAQKLVWSGDDTATWQSGGGSDWDSNADDLGDKAFADGNRVLFDDGPTSYAVHVAGSVSPISVTFSNSPANNYVVSGASINGAGSLRIDNGGTVTLANIANAYTGDTNITSGRLNLSGAAQIVASPNINVSAGSTMDVTDTSAGTLSLDDQTLNLEGHFVGHVQASNDATVKIASSSSLIGNLAVKSGSLAAGSGLVIGSLEAIGGTVRVGEFGLPRTLSSSTVVIDDFDDMDLSEYAQTIVNDQGFAFSNVEFSAAAQSLEATFSGFPSYEQVLLLRDDVALNVGDKLAVDVFIGTTSQPLDLGLAVSATAAPTAASNDELDSRASFDWTSISVRPNQDGIRVNRSIDGTVSTTIDALGGVPESSVTTLYIERNSLTQFTVGYSNTIENDVSLVTFTAADVGTALGFYADLRANGSLGTFDNLRIISDNGVTYSGETLTIEGDVSLSPEAVLQLDAYSPAAVDLLSVSGHFTAGGTLELLLESGAPNPSLGDRFAVLEYASASGNFDTFELPILTSGLAWNVSSLLTTGGLEVVADVDLDDDGDVDGNDFLIIQSTDPALLADWQTQFGHHLIPSLAAMSQAVPEPSTMLVNLSGLLLGFMFFHRL